jgi:hypothetical protein
VSVRFFDDETLEGVARDLDFDEPDFLLEVEGAHELENNETAWIPLNSIKYVELPHDEHRPPETPTRRVAIRFFDGEVLRGHIDGALSRHRHGLVLHLHPENAEGPGRPRRLGIPFSAIKALFYVRSFDGRPSHLQGTPSDSFLARRTMAPLLDVLDEMDMLQRLHESGVLSDEEFQAKRTSVLERM